MDKIGKALQKLKTAEKDRIKSILTQLASGDVTGLDIKKLKGREDIFRVRKGDIRILYRKDKNEIIHVLSVERRKEDTYRF